MMMVMMINLYVNNKEEFWSTPGRILLHRTQTNKYESLILWLVSGSEGMRKEKVSLSSIWFLQFRERNGKKGREGGNI